MREKRRKINLTKQENNAGRALNTSKIAFLSGAIFVSFALADGIACADVVDGVVAVVNDQTITKSEVREALRPLKEHYSEVYRGSALENKLKEARGEVIERLIEDKLILDEAKRVGIEIRSDEVDAMLEEVRSRFPSAEEFERLLKLQDLTIWQLKKTYKEQLMVKKMVRLYVKAHAEVTPVEISQYYNRHREDFKQKESVNISQILIRYQPEEEPSRTQKRAQQVAELLKLGADFSDIAKKFSEGSTQQEGGGMGYIQRGRLSEELEDAVFSLNEGEVSSPIKTKLGFIIFRLNEKRPERYQPISELRSTIENILLDGKTKAILKEWLKELKENAFISIKE